MTRENTEVEIIEENPEQTNPSDGTQNTDEPESVDNHIPYDRFKQKVDEANALKKKLAEIEAEQEAEKQQKLKEKEDYKTLYEEAQNQIKAQQEDALNAKKDLLLIQAGYESDKIKLLRKLVEGETDEELTQSIEILKETFPVEAKKTYVDPGLGNGAKSKPKQVDGEDVGRNMFESLLKSGRIKGFKSNN